MAYGAIINGVNLEQCYSMGLRSVIKFNSDRLWETFSTGIISDVRKENGQGQVNGYSASGEVARWSFNVNTPIVPFSRLVVPFGNMGGADKVFGAQVFQTWGRVWVIYAERQNYDNFEIYLFGKTIKQNNSKYALDIRNSSGELVFTTDTVFLRGLEIIGYQAVNNLGQVTLNRRGKIIVPTATGADVYDSGYNPYWDSPTDSILFTCPVIDSNGDIALCPGPSGAIELSLANGFLSNEYILLASYPF